MVLLSLLVFACVACAALAMYVWLAPYRTAARLRSLSGQADEPAQDSVWSSTLMRAAEPLAKLSAPEGDWQSSALRVKFLNAGIRSESARLVYFAAKTVLPLGFAAIAYLVASPGAKSFLTLMLYVVLAATVGVFLPNLVLHLRARSRQREIFETFPDAADLMLVCVEAGLGLDAALVKVTDEIRIKSENLAQELRLTILEMRAGGSREQALRNLALRTGVEEVGAFAVMLTQADKFGTSIGQSLRVFSDDLRHKRQTRAEERAAKIPTKMLFPLVTCIFPAIIMVILGPAVIQIVRTLMPALAR